jgi:hypothetical protein
MIPDLIENTGRTITGQLCGIAVLHFVLGVPLLGSMAGAGIMFAVSWVNGWCWRRGARRAARAPRSA